MSVARRPVSVPLLMVALLVGGLAVLLESQLRLGLKLPGHRAFPGALALTLVASAAPRALLGAFAAVVGALIAAMTGNPLLLAVWLLPALLLIAARPRSTIARAAIAIAAGLAFGLLRYLALPEALHHTPDAVRLAGHLAFGALGAVGAAIGPRVPSEPR